MKAQLSGSICGTRHCYRISFALVDRRLAIYMIDTWHLGLGERRERQSSLKGLNLDDSSSRHCLCEDSWYVLVLMMNCIVSVDSSSDCLGGGRDVSTAYYHCTKSCSIHPPYDAGGSTSNPNDILAVNAYASFEHIYPVEPESLQLVPCPRGHLLRVSSSILQNPPTSPK